jgi:hypothetical protein
VTAVSGVIDLDASARTSGALVRRREIRSGEALLRLALAYGPGGLSLRAAAAWAGATGLADLSDTAVLNRLRKAADWLGEIAGALLRRAAAEPRPASPPTGPLPGRRLRIADASVVTHPGSVGPDWRLHATYDPAAGRFTNLELTDRGGAESFGRTAWRAGDVAIGDRDYARPPGLRQILAAGAEFIVRTGWKQLRLLDADGAPVAWEQIFDALAPGEVTERMALVDYSGKGRRSRGKAVFPARLVVLRLPPEATARAVKAAHRRHSRCHARKLLRPLTLRAAGHLMLVTSLPATVPAAEVLAAYRLRWQVELAFKRLKSLLGFGRLPAKGEALARSWLLAHLVFALLIDDTAQGLLAVPPSRARSAWVQPSPLALAAGADTARRAPRRRSRRADPRPPARRLCPARRAPPRAPTKTKLPVRPGQRKRWCVSWRP